MLNTKALRNEAKAAFVPQVSQLVIFITTQAYVYRFDDKLKELNTIIVAAQKFEVTRAKVFTEEEIKELTQDLKDLHALGMKRRMNEHLIAALKNKGLEEEALVKCVATEEELKKS